MAQSDRPGSTSGESSAVDGGPRESVAEAAPGPAPESQGSVLRLALEGTSDGIVLIGEDRRVLAANRRFAEMCRVPEEALHSRRTDRLLAAIAPQLEEPGMFRRALRRLDADDALGEHTLRFRDGRVFVLRSQPGSAEAGQGRRVWSFRDVTARVRAESLLQQTSEQYEDLVRHTDAAIFELDLVTGRFVSVNEVMCRLTGYSEDELLHMDPSGLLVEEDLPVFQERWERAREGSAPTDTVQYRWCRKDGHQSWAVSSVKLVRAQDGTSHLVGVALDVGARERAEQDRQRMRDELLRAQKHESLSVMAAGVAHDFNNLLQVILGNADLLACDVQPGQESFKAVEQIRKAASRATELSQQMLTFAGQVDGAHQEEDLADVVHAAWDLLRSVTGEQTALRLEIEPARRVLANAGEVERLLMNLVLNAVESMPSERGGTIVVRVGEAEGAPSSLPCFPTSQSHLGPCAALEVEDDGSGMDAETVRRAFDPFFTTKFTGRGLGLATVLGIVRGHGGRVVVDSRPDHGTRIQVLLPVARS
jgi:PAS domain S-box-containing protein